MGVVDKGVLLYNLSETMLLFLDNIIYERIAMYRIQPSTNSNNISNLIRNKVKEMPQGKVFTAEGLLTRSIKSLAQSENIQISSMKARILRSLSRLHEEGELRRIQNGVYYKPEFSSSFHFELPPSIPAVVEVLAKKNHESLQVHGGEATNRIGLSTQMALQVTFYTNGTSRDVEVAGSSIRFIHTKNKKLLQHYGTNVGIAISALNYLGKELVTEKVVNKVRSFLSEQEFLELMNSALPEWLHEELRSSEMYHHQSQQRSNGESYTMIA